MSYSGKRIVVTGGLGFIGSNLAIRLVELGARVTLIDAFLKGRGANRHNIYPIRKRVRIIPRDIRHAAEFADELRGCSVVFNLAGQAGPARSMEESLRDLQVNALSQLQFLRTCARVAPGVRVVYAGSREEQNHLNRPADFHAVHKFAATTYHLLLSERGALDAVVLRLPDVYGPRMPLSMKPSPDALYLDDAVNAFLLAGAAPRLTRRIYDLSGEIQRNGFGEEFGWRPRIHATTGSAPRTRSRKSTSMAAAPEDRAPSVAHPWP